MLSHKSTGATRAFERAQKQHPHQHAALLDPFIFRSTLQLCTPCSNVAGDLFQCFRASLEHEESWLKKMVFHQFSSYISAESHMHKLANSTNLRIHQRKSQLDAWNKQECPVICLGGIKNMKTWRIFLLCSTLLLSSPFISCFFGSFGVLRLNQSCQIHNSRRCHLSPQDSTTGPWSRPTTCTSLGSTKTLRSKQLRRVTSGCGDTMHRHNFARKFSKTIADIADIADIHWS